MHDLARISIGNVSKRMSGERSGDNCELIQWNLRVNVVVRKGKTRENILNSRNNDEGSEFSLVL